MIVSAAFTLDSIAQAQAMRMVAALTLGSAVAIAGALVLRCSRRIPASVRYAVSLLLLFGIAGVAMRSAGSSATGESSVHAFALSLLWARYLFLAWGVIAAAGLLRVIAGLWRVRELKLSSRGVFSPDEQETGRAPSLPDQVAEAAALVNQRRRFGRAVELRLSEQVKVPAAFGFFRPAVILPAWMIEDAAVSPDDLNQLVLHELAHLKRWDDWANLAQKLIKALLFFQPAVWWLDARIAAEREMACDDAVIRSTANAHGYAQCLARLAERSYVRRALRHTAALAQAAIGRLTSARVARILQMQNSKCKMQNWRVAGLGASVAVLVLGAAIVHAPEVITFSQPPVQATSFTPHKSGSQMQPLAMIPTALRETRPAASLPKAKHQAAVLRAKNDVATQENDRFLSRSRGIGMTSVASADVARTDQAPMLVLIETRQQFTSADGVVQVESWRVVMIAAPAPPPRAVPHKDI